MIDPLSPAVFIDRDGTIMQDADYCSDPREVKIFPRVAEALRRLKSKGFKLIIITNQSGIGRGFFTVEQYRAVEAEVLRQLGDGLIDATYFCPDVPGQHSSCRKPAPGMIVEATREHQIDLARSFLIGDKEIDAECGRNVGMRTIRVRTGFDRETAGSMADWVAEDLPAAAEIILNTT
ncbi:MAG: HAD family hydrolase [Verrucomicrobia bacterium]|nr:MAG: D,D-heptose 1,7-bisphosphate phosphatase [Verrucomicrobia bacterium 13_2_20CM_55_10]PYI42548.1 MAG: HAD family hydrolase [Verrucomicrobiota bacterium]